MMKLKINGNNTEVPEGLSVTLLLEQQKVKMPDMVSVEVNGEILERDSFEETILCDGDHIEFLYFMGGGTE